MLSAADQHLVGLLAVGTLVWGDEWGIGLLVVSFGVIFQTTQKQKTLTPNLGIRFPFEVMAHDPDAALLREPVISVVIGSMPKIAPQKHWVPALWQCGMRCRRRPK